jgi:hypothetical protein
MRTIPLNRRGLFRAAGLILGLLTAGPSAVRSQTIDAWDPSSAIPKDFGLAGSATSSPSASNPQRIRIFRIAPGFISDPVGLQDVDDTPPGAVSSTPPPLPDNGSGPDWIQVAMGTDNPYFDFRQRGDPGGVGFYRLNTQLQLVDTRATSCALCLQAVSPAGIQYNGVPDGPTVFSPQLGWFHAIDNDTAVQGYIGKHMLVNSTGTSPVLQRNLQYGMAVQRSLASLGAEPLRNVYVYMGALGQYRPEHNENSGTTLLWQMLPGVHWKLADNLWVSGGVILPVGPSRFETSTALPWQLTCSFQF